MEKRTISSLNNCIFEAEYHATKPDPKLGFPHYEDSIELLQMWSSGGFFSVKGKVYPILPGTLLLVNAAEPHYANPASPTGYSRSKIILSGECFWSLLRLTGLDYLGENLLSDGCMIRHLDPAHAESIRIDRLFRAAREHFPAKPCAADQAVIIHSLIYILMTFSESRGQTPEKEKDPSDNLVRQLTDYINTHLSSWQNLSLNDISDSLHISKSYASHLFKKLTGKSFTQYLSDLRIAEAERLLSHTDMKILEISNRLEYCNSTVFCRTFRECTGYTPRQYRSLPFKGAL